MVSRYPGAYTLGPMAICGWGSCSPQTWRMQGMYYSTPCSTYVSFFLCECVCVCFLSLYPRSSPSAQLLPCICEQRCERSLLFSYCNYNPLGKLGYPCCCLISHISPPTWFHLSNITGRLPAVGTAHCSGLCCFEEPLSDPETSIAAGTYAIGPFSTMRFP